MASLVSKTIARTIRMARAIQSRRSGDFCHGLIAIAADGPLLYSPSSDLRHARASLSNSTLDILAVQKRNRASQYRLPCPPRADANLALRSKVSTLGGACTEGDELADGGWCWCWGYPWVLLADGLW